MLTFLRRLKSAPPAPEAFLPQDMRCFAIGDIHGRLDLLTMLLDEIRLEVADADPAKTYLVFLGDYIDRGPASCEVLDLLVDGNIAWATPVFLRGNHEEAFLRSLKGDLRILRNWMGFGGMETCESYGLSGAAWYNGDPEQFLQRLLKLVPPAHVAFLEELYDSFALGDYLFVHAGVKPGTPINEQLTSDMRWIRDDFLKAKCDFGKLVVHGHTVSDEPELRTNRIGIDTGAYKTGRLTALALDGGERRFIIASDDRALADAGTSR